MRADTRFILIILLIVSLSVTVNAICPGLPAYLMCMCRAPPNCCGDGICQPGENIPGSPIYCSADLPLCPPTISAFCGDHSCDGGAGETSANCPSDCGSCGNSIQEPESGENCQTCPQDYGTCPSCTVDNGPTVCPASLPPIQQNCTFAYCDPQTKKCAYEMGALTGKTCGDEGHPYSDECHVDVCMDGVCFEDAPIVTGNPRSAGGLPPLSSSQVPWIQGACIYDPMSHTVTYIETPIVPFCGNGVPEGGETSSNCCKDAGCPNPTDICTFSGACIPATSTAVTALTANWSSWVTWIVIALLIGYFLAALVYMASHIISSPELEAWAKNELYETSVSALFVGSAVFAVGLLTTISVTLIGASYVTIADNYVTVLSADLLYIYGLLSKGVFAMGLMSYIGAEASTPTVSILVVTIGMSGGLYPFGGMGLLTNTLVMYTNIVTFAILSVIGQKVILDFVLQSAFAVLLPLGVLMRSFTFTRKIGATIMAIAIGAYVVYPITLFMNYQIYSSVPRIPQHEFHSNKLPLSAFDAGSWMDIFLGPDFGRYCKHWWDWLAFCWLRAIIEWVIAFIKAIGSALAFVIVVLAAVVRYGVAEVTASGFDYYANMIPWAIQPVTAAFLFPILDLIVVITAMRSLSEAMGGESKISGLAEFI